MTGWARGGIRLGGGGLSSGESSVESGGVCRTESWATNWNPQSPGPALGRTRAAAAPGARVGRPKERWGRTCEQELWPGAGTAGFRGGHPRPVGSPDCSWGLWLHQSQAGLDCDASGPGGREGVSSAAPPW